MTTEMQVEQDKMLTALIKEKCINWYNKK